MARSPRSSRLTLPTLAAALGIGERTLTRHQSALIHLRGPNGYRRQDLPKLRRAWQRYTAPLARTHISFADLARMSGRSGPSIIQLRVRGLIQFERHGRRLWLRRRDLPQALALLDQHSRVPAGFMTATDLADTLGVEAHAICRAVRSGLLTPSGRAGSGAILFAKARLAEHMQAWNDRFEASPAGTPQRVVLTEDGVIRPRRHPDPAVLAGALALREVVSKQPSSRRPVYDLFADLQSPRRGGLIFQNSLKTLTPRRNRQVASAPG